MNLLVPSNNCPFFYLVAEFEGRHPVLAAVAVDGRQHVPSEGLVVPLQPLQVLVGAADGALGIVLQTGQQFAPLLLTGRI